MLAWTSVIIIVGLLRQQRLEYMKHSLYLYICLQPFTLGQEGLFGWSLVILEQNLLDPMKNSNLSNACPAFPWKCLLTEQIPPHLEDISIDWRLWMKKKWSHLCVTMSFLQLVCMSSQCWQGCHWQQAESRLVDSVNKFVCFDHIKSIWSKFL